MDFFKCRRDAGLSGVAKGEDGRSQDDRWVKANYTLYLLIYFGKFFSGSTRSKMGIKAPAGNRSLYKLGFDLNNLLSLISLRPLGYTEFNLIAFVQ